MLKLIRIVYKKMGLATTALCLTAMTATQSFAGEFADEALLQLATVITDLTAVGKFMIGVVTVGIIFALIVAFIKKR